MTRRPAADSPWSVPVIVEQIPEDGLRQSLATTPQQRAAMAAEAGVPAMPQASARFELTPAGRGRVRVTGQVQGEVAQTCVVTLEPLQNVIDEPVDVLFAPEDQIEALTKAQEEAAEAGEETGDPPEPITDGRIDLGKLAADVLFLAIDPYPRKPGAVFEPPAEAEDPEAHPFAALAKLKGGPAPGEG
jgi:uncharacterized metal-binding protein YceD (DUF177 family)